MKQEQFRELLVDLYNVYDPTNENIDFLTKKYGDGLEHIAVQSILLKYNTPSHQHYDSSISSSNIEDIAFKIVNDFRNGKRFMLQEKVEKKSEKVEESKDEIDLYGVIQELKNRLDALESASKIRIKLTLMGFKKSDILEFPSDEVFSRSSVGERFMLLGSEKRIIGLEVTDILVDQFSGDELIKELTLKKI